MSRSNEQLVKDLFGRPLRIYLAEWILGRGHDPFFQTEAQDGMRRLGLRSASSVPGVLALFEEHGMVTRLQSEQRVYFTRLESPLWAAFDAIATALRELEANGQASSSQRQAE